MIRTKFRGKTVSGNVWISGSLIQDNAQSRITTDLGIGRYTSEMCEVKSFEVYPETIGQYTGLKDKNGKEICAGDILTADKYPFQSEGKLNYISIVFWSENEAAFGIELHCVNPEIFGVLNGVCYSLTETPFEIIGNIHDNPELLSMGE